MYEDYGCGRSSFTGAPPNHNWQFRTVVGYWEETFGIQAIYELYLGAIRCYFDFLSGSQQQK